MADHEDVESVKAWQVFLTRYAAGEYGPETAPSIPPIPTKLVRSLDQGHIPAPWAFANAPLYTSSSGVPIEDARQIRDYYCENHYLPPPRSPLESQRPATINDHDLYSPKQLANIQAATDLISSFFPKALCTFSLFHEHIQKHYCPAGPPSLIQKFGITPGLRIPAEDSLCGHAVLHCDSTFFVSDLKKDWRYINNPFVFAGFQSFIGSTVSLTLDPLEDDSPRVVVGTLNVCFVDEPIEEFDMAQRKVVRNVTTMLETQLRATWEGDQRTKEGRARVALSELIETALVDVTLRDGDRVSHEALEKICKVLPDVDSIALINSGGVESVSAENIWLTAGREICGWGWHT